ncbi:MAG: phenylalanine--tRNA ligase subunit beta [Actinobacteria bacterium]|nr:phenylalanine--tRNA ligase subunit beta [Actinomycetota bacterium]
MRVPLSWLREYSATDLPAEELAELLIARGVHVEGVLRPWEGLDGVVVARVVEVRDHPNSDKLCLARVETGSGELELVVGIRNIGPGDLVPLAPPGARVPALPQPLGAREIRGVVSNGMLCSASELAVSHDHGGILILNGEGWEPGTDLKSALGLGDAVLDVEVEPNRPDFLSIYGIAREAAAATGVPLVGPDLSIEEADEEASVAATVRIDAADGCPHYVARVIRGVRPGTSPLLVQARLTACGMRPLSNVIDATNYVMLELGQPLHGFDLALLAGPGIVVRRAREGERLVTLDGVERGLSPEDLLICDADKPVAIAGVMGGRTSEVSGETSDVLLESAYFTRTGILRTARRLGLHTEASHRFERGTDPEGVPPAAARAAKLIAAWSGGRVLRGSAEAGAIGPRRWVSMRPERASALVGYDIAAADAVRAFDSLGMKSSLSAGTVEVEVPGYRVDVDREVDLIEEVARVEGYDRVGSSLPRPPQAGGMPRAYAFARAVKDVLVRAGLREVRPVPFASQGDLAITGDADAVAVANPLRAEEGHLRTRLTPGLLRAVARNQAGGVRSVALFEVGVVFRLGDPVEERRKVAMALCGPAGEGWAAERRDLDVYDAKGALESLMGGLGVRDWELGDSPGGPFHPGRSAWVLVNGERAGVLGEIHPGLAASLDIEGRVAVVELEFDALLMAATANGFSFQEVPRFPPIRRDLAFVLPEVVAAGAVRAAIEQAGGDLLDRCLVFDVFRGSALPPGTKSLAFALDFRSPDRTLTDEEAEETVGRIVSRVEGEFGARLRAG